MMIVLRGLYMRNMTMNVRVIRYSVKGLVNRTVKCPNSYTCQISQQLAYSRVISCFHSLSQSLISAYANR